MSEELIWKVNPNQGEKYVAAAQKLAKYPTGVLCDAIFGLKDPRNYIIGNRIHSIKPGLKLAGVALTVKAPAGNSFAAQYAIYTGFKGAVLVIDCGGFMEGPYLGDLMVASARGLGYAGIIVDGCVRDLAEIAAMDYPVFVRGGNPRKPFKKQEGQLNVPVTIDGAPVNPSDILIGDDDGIVIICPDCVDALIPLAEKKLATDDARAAKIAEFCKKPESERNIDDIMGADFIRVMHGMPQ